MRNKFFSLLMPFVVITALVLTACSEPETNLITKNRCTITFNTMGAATETPETITVARGKTMGGQYPADPEMNGTNFLFYGWWDSGIEYNQNSVINSDLDLTARWARQQDTVTVTFNAPGATPPSVSIQVLKGEPIGLRIPVARKKGYTFDGWFYGAAQYTAFAPVINANITVTAAFTEKTKHTVSFVTVDKNYLTDPTAEQCTLTDIEVYEGEGLEADMPGLPGAQPVTHNDNKVKFVMWTGGEGELYDEWTPIYGDMIFHAKWGLDPFFVDLSKTQLVPGAVSAQTPDLKPAYYPAGNDGKGSIKNEVKYDGAENRWYIMYRIGLVNKTDETKSVLPLDFNMGYYSRYTVRARFYGNERAILGNPLYASGYMNDANAIKNAGDEMPPQAGYGQISWCVTAASNGNPGQDKAGVIAQQYNLGTTTINNTWKVGGDFFPAGGRQEDAIRPPFLLIQTSDNWIGWIEITEIIFHNGEEQFVPPPEAGE